jgi:very-short-patch-repair endonuclease
MKNKYAVRTITCLGCGKVITDHMPPNKRYCSKTCYRCLPRLYAKTGNMVKCTICGNLVYVPLSRLHRSEHLFCSPEHANEWQARNKTKCVCKSCGIQFNRSASMISKNGITYCSSHCRDVDPDRHEQLMQMIVKQQSLNNIERRGYTLLDSLGVEYQSQYIIGSKFCVDAFIPSLLLVIQFDGDYWHGNPAIFPDPDVRQRKRMVLDTSQDAYMQVCGYTVIRIWASDLEHNITVTKERLERYL